MTSAGDVAFGPAKGLLRSKNTARLQMQLRRLSWAGVELIGRQVRLVIAPEPDEQSLHGRGDAGNGCASVGRTPVAILKIWKTSWERWR